MEGAVAAPIDVAAAATKTALVATGAVVGGAVVVPLEAAAEVAVGALAAGAIGRHAGEVVNIMTPGDSVVAALVVVPDVSKIKVASVALEGDDERSLLALRNTLAKLKNANEELKEARESVGGR